MFPTRRRLLRLAAAAAAAPVLARAAQPVERPSAQQLVLLADDDGRQFTVTAPDTMEPLHRWRMAEAVHVAPKFSPDARSVLLGSPGGSISRRELPAGRETGHVAVGGALGDFVMSDDGQWLLAAHGGALTLFDRDLQPVRRYAAASLDGKVTSRVAAVFHAAGRRSFVVAFETLPELWEISYDRAAPPIFDGLVHDYRMGEAIATGGFLGVRRTPLEEPFTALALDAGHRHVLGADRSGTLAVLNLDVRRRIARLPVAAPSPGLLADFVQQGAPRLAVAAADGTIHIVGAAPWRLERTLRSAAREAVWLRTHPRSAFLWLGTQAGDGALLTLIDKDTLEVAGTLGLPARLLGPVAFAGDGRAWISVRDREDAILVVDERSRKVAGRLPTGANPAAWPVS